jgi:hypothetical protein
MIEELTPLLLAGTLMLDILAASALTLLASVTVLGLYRRRVLQAMAVGSGEAAIAADAPDDRAPAFPAGRGDEFYRRALRGPWRAEWRDAIAGLVFALLMTIALALAFPALSPPQRLVWYAWGYSWPVLLAWLLTGPGGLRATLLALAAYAAPLLLGTLYALTAEVAPLRSDIDVAALRDAITPFDAAKGWLVANGLPTALLLMFLNRRVRAVGPLLLGLITVATTGVVLAWLAVFTKAGSGRFAGVTVAIAEAGAAAGLTAPWLLRAVLYALLLLILLAALFGFGRLGWWLLQRLRRAYLRKAINDRTLALDALWLYFAACYAMLLSTGGLAWALAPLLAYAGYKTTWRALLPRAPPPNARGLTFLRVFSLGWRSDRLLAALARHWRHVGSLQLITGPDVAHSTVQPHQLLDFLAGRLASHFIGDAASLAARMRALDVAPDRDGRYRINNFFCRADTWQAVLARLVRNGDVVLMDLRSFTREHAGCVHELRHLVEHVALQRCVLVIDDSTDQAFVQHTLNDAFATLPPRSPNRDASPDSVVLHRYGGGRAALRHLLRRLCAAG